MITTTEERPHPLITALTAANAGQGGLNEAVADAVDIMLSDNKCVDWTLLWDYQDDRFVLEPVFGRTIYLAFFSTSHLGRAAKAARANKDKEELLRLQIKAVRAHLKRDRLDLMQRHVCKEAIPGGIWLHYHTGYFEPEWLMEQKPEYLFERDESFKHLLRIGAVQMAAGRSLLNPDAPELTGHPVFEELVSRFSELILDPRWEKYYIESHTQLELSYYARRFGAEAVLDRICERAISHSMLTGHNAITRERDALRKISALLEDLDTPLNSEWLNKLLERFKLLEIWGWRVRDKEKWPDLTQSLLYEVRRIRQLA